MSERRKAMGLRFAGRSNEDRRLKIDSAQIEKWFEAAKTGKEMARILGCSSAAVLKVVRQLGLKRPEKSDRAHFEGKFLVTPGCWIWQEGLSQDGYGQFRARDKGWRAHRFSFTLYVGPIPAGMNVCHKCDNRLCVNPDHLWLGTNGDNNSDRHSKGRSADNHAVLANWCRGTSNASAKLNDDLVRAIRADGRPQVEIAADYGVTAAMISLIKKRKAWRHVE